MTDISRFDEGVVVVGRRECINGVDWEPLLFGFLPSLVMSTLVVVSSFWTVEQILVDVRVDGVLDSDVADKDVGCGDHASTLLEYTHPTATNSSRVDTIGISRGFFIIK